MKNGLEHLIDNSNKQNSDIDDEIMNQVHYLMTCF